MAYSGYSWTPSHSLTAIKYQRHGFVEKKPFLPGERYVVVSKDAFTVKKGYRFFRPQPGCHLPNPPWAGFIKLFPARESLVSNTPTGDGKVAKLFYSVVIEHAEKNHMINIKTTASLYTVILFSSTY
jgi:hypothetical protein